MKNKAAFHAIARSVGYRMGKKQGLWAPNQPPPAFYLLFQPEYAHVALHGYMEGKRWAQAKGAIDTYGTVPYKKLEEEEK